MESALIRLPQVLSLTGYSRSTLYKRISEKLFTTPVKLGERCAAWPVGEIDAINKARIAGAKNEQLEELVRTLTAQRNSASAIQ